MPSVNETMTPVAVDIDAVEGRYAPLGAYTGRVRDIPEGCRPGPVLRWATR